MERYPPKRSLDKILTHANFCEGWSRGFGVARGRILAFSIDLLRCHYNTLATTVGVSDQTPLQSYLNCLVQCLTIRPATGGGVSYPPPTVTFESFKMLTHNFLHLMCEKIFYTFMLPEISRDIRDFMTSPEMLKSQRQLTQPRHTCILVTINALCSISNVFLFTADFKTIVLVYHLVSNIQDGSRKPEVLITSQLLKIETSFQRQNGATCTKRAVCTRHLLTLSDTIVCQISKMACNNWK